jgi:hypothetical protein
MSLPQAEKSLFLTVPGHYFEANFKHHSAGAIASARRLEYAHAGDFGAGDGIRT